MDVIDRLKAAPGTLAFERVPLHERLGDTRTPLEALEKVARKYPDAIALIAYRGLDQAPSIKTYSGLLEEIYAYANAFRKAGIRRGDCIAYLLPNLAETHYTLWGGGAAGIVCAINPFLDAKHIAGLLAASDAKILVTCSSSLDPDIGRKVEELGELGKLPFLTVTVDEPAQSSVSGQRLGSISALINDATRDRLEFNDRPSGSDVAAYFHTGGTTGVPKLASHTHSNQLINALLAADMTSMTTADVALVGLPLFHVNAVYVSGLAPLMSGATVLIAGPNGFRNPELVNSFWRMVSQHAVTFFNAVPTVFTMLLDRSSTPNDPATSLRYAGSGGAPMPPAVFKAFQKRFKVPIIEGYGLTEATCMVSCNPLGGEPKVGSVGMRVAYHDLCIGEQVNGRVIPAGAGETGQLFIKGPCVFAGYKNGEVTVLEDGWLPTGDLARVDDDGYVWLAGRTKDIIIRGGHNIDPAMVEEVLHQHEAVALAAVVAKPDIHAGERPTAFVSLKPGAKADSEALRSFVAKRLGERAAIPDCVTIVENMPVTAVGKIYKPPLRSQAAQVAISEVVAGAGVARSAFSVTVREERHGLIAEVQFPDGAIDPKLLRALERFPLTIEIKSRISHGA